MRVEAHHKRLGWVYIEVGKFDPLTWHFGLGILPFHEGVGLRIAKRQGVPLLIQFTAQTKSKKRRTLHVASFCGRYFEKDSILLN